MSDAKLMMPLFCNGMFNCGGRRIRAVHLYDVSDGEHRYRLWTKAGTPDIDYSRLFDTTTRRHIMQYTDNEAALIGGLISTYFLRPAVSAALKDSYTRVLEHLRTGRLSAGDLQQIQKALTFLTPTCRMSREAQRDLMGVNLKTTALLRSCH